MRDLLFKNLTSDDKRRRIIASAEIADSQGVHREIRRHFVYMIREAKQGRTGRLASAVYIRKERSRKEEKEEFFCKIKGAVYVLNKGRMFLVPFLHSLKITLTPSAQIPQ